MALTRTVGAPGNFAAGARLGYGVGDLDFLDSEASKVQLYFRGLEYGSTKFIGKVFYGVFGEGSRYAAQGTNFYGVGAFSPVQQFFPLGYAASLIGNNHTGPNRGSSGSTSNSPTAKVLRHLAALGDHGRSLRMIIKNPIVAQEAYERAFASFDAGEKERAAVVQVFGNIGFRSGGTRFTDLKGGSTLHRVADSGTGRRTPTKAQTASFLGRTKLLVGNATSSSTRSLVSIDRTFQAELVRINKLLAEGLANEVARIQQEEIKRTATSTGRLVAATIDPRNRFPS